MALTPIPLNNDNFNNVNRNNKKIDFGTYKGSGFGFYLGASLIKQMLSILCLTANNFENKLCRNIHVIHNPLGAPPNPCEGKIIVIK